MSAQVKVYAQGCIDPRYRSAFEQFIQKKFNLRPTEYDLKTDAGGSREIALGTPNGEWMLTNAGIAYQKHGARTFVLCNHMDCAHYGGASHFSGPNEETSVYSNDLKKAAATIKSRFQGIQVLAYIASKEKRSLRDAFVFQEISI